MIRKASAINGLVNASPETMGDVYSREALFAYRCCVHVASAFLILFSLIVSEPILAANVSSQASVKTKASALHVHENRAKIFRAESGKTLTASSAEETLVVTKKFLNSNNIPSTATDALVQTRKFKNDGLVVADYEQLVLGLRVYGSHVRAVTKETGELVFISSNIVAPNAQAIRSAEVDDQRALMAVVKIHYPKVTESFPVVTTNGNSRVFGKGKSFYSDPRVEKILVSQPNGTLEEGYLVETWDNDNVLKHTVVNSRGRVVSKQDRSANDSYNIFPINPDASAQTIVSGPGAGNALSQLGWVFSDTTIGNNARAYLDTNADNAIDTNGMPISSTKSFVAAAQLNLPPEFRDNQMAAVQNAFYWTNVIHDELFRHGFTEEEGNFQYYNFTATTGSKDPVFVQVQDGSKKNNASFATPVDGLVPVMRLHLFDLKRDEFGYVTNVPIIPARDVAFDSDLLWHEYGHGLTWRMTGDMTLSSDGITGAVGEGFSDALAILATDNDVFGEYSGDKLSGTRSRPYAGYVITLDSYFCGSPGYVIDCNVHVHFNGEVLAASIWRVWELWKAKGLARDLLIDHLVRSLTVAPPKPTFADIRNGLLMKVGSQNECLVWEAFAQFGIGVGGGQVGTPTKPTVSFTIPSTCSTDTIIPAAVSDLRIGSIGSRSAQIEFTATGDDGSVGTAAGYEVRYSQSPITKFNFDAATRLEDSPKPLASGTFETLSLRNLSPATRYYVALIAVDEVGNKSPLSNVIAITTRPARTIFSDAFEAGSGNWVATGTDGVGGGSLWHLSTHRSNSPEVAMYYGRAGTFSYDTGAANSGALTSVPVDLSSAVESTLSFKHSLETEGLFEFYDKARVEVSQDGGMTWQPTFIARSDTNGIFETVKINLSPFDGRVVQIRFVFDTIDEGANQFEGWIIDDVVVDAVDAPGTNQLPVSIPGNDQIVLGSQKTFLSGVNSYDTDGVISSYKWTQISGPVITLANPTSMVANFIAPPVLADVSLSFKLTVTDNSGASSFATTNVTVKKANMAPTVNAGADQTVVKGAIVTLSGSGTDSDGPVAAYAWSQIGGPVVTLTNPASAVTSFTAPLVTSNTVLMFRFTVTDEFGAMTSDDVAITVQYINFVPIANAGPDQTVNKQVTVTLYWFGNGQ